LGVVVGQISPRAGYVLQFFPAFMGGIVAYKLTKGQVVNRWPAWSWPLFIVVMIMLYGTSVTLAHVSIWSYSRRGYLAVGVISLGLGSMLPRFQHATNRVGMAIAKALAKYSYGIYLTHLSAMWFTMIFLRGKVHPVIQWSILAILAVTLPVACFHFVERPMMKLGRKLTPAERKPDTALRAAATA
jgi:peptidoglycan/LPS O-acetylase OafA/YrhL